MPTTYLLAPSKILWKLLETYGHDPVPVFSEVGIDRDMILKPGARISLSAGDHLWAKASELIDDPCFGLKGADIWHPSHMHALGYAWLASSTLREAFKRLCRYIHVVSEIVAIELEDTTDGLTIGLSFKIETKDLYARTDSAFAILMAMCRMNYGPDLNPTSVTLVHPKPACSDRYFAYFKAPVEFSSEKNTIVLPPDKIDERLKGCNPQIARSNDKAIIRYLASLKKENIAHQVKAAIISALPSGGVSDEKVAPALNMSVRSLQRNLKSAGTTFGKLLEEVRMELADSYIRDQDFSLTEIAFVLGFSEQSAFSRAYKRWTGMSPSVMRETKR